MESKRPHKKVVLITGMYRSGSTFIFNAVRVLHLHSKKKVWGGGTGGFVGTTGHEADVYIVKEHRWHEALARYGDVVITSQRPIKQSWLSMNRFKEEDIPWPATREWVTWLHKWKNVSDYCMYWDDFADEEGPWNALKDIAHVLGLDHLNLVNVMKHLRSELAPPKEGKNHETLVFSNHYTSVDYEDIKQTFHIPERDLE